MTTLEMPSSRGPRGRWAPGQSGNPTGKKPGTQNRTTRLRELLADGDDALAVRVLMDAVRAGGVCWRTSLPTMRRRRCRTMRWRGRGSSGFPRR